MNPNEDVNAKLVSQVYRAIANLQTDINIRNEKINKRYRYIYQEGLYEETQIKSGADRTRYNLLRRVLEIHASQVMGRLFNIKSTYDKQDLDVYNLPGGGADDQQKQQKDQAIILNGRRAMDADVRVKAFRDIVEDNGGWALWQRAAHVAEWAGFAAFKCWPDTKNKRYNITLIETPQNFGAAWSDSNFRETDFYYYNYQISLSNANRTYASKLKPDATGVAPSFNVSKPGGAVNNEATSAEDLEKLGQKMVWVTDVTGYFEGFKAKSGKVVECDPGQETEMSLLIVGGQLVETVTNPKLLPKHFMVNCLEEPQNPWGVSTISDELMQINGTIIQIVSDWIGHVWKTAFAKYKFKGFTAMNLPKNNDRTVEGFPLDVDQDIELLQPPQTNGEFTRLLDFQMDQFVKHARVSRVMLDDPSVNSTSDRALMTQMKPMVDVTREKQIRWSKLLTDIAHNALEAVADFDDALKEAITDAGVWKMKFIWPSVLNREDQSYQQMYLNRWNAGTISPESFMEAMGDEDVTEELDRLRDTMVDPLRSAMVGHKLDMLAGHTINASLGIPPWGYVLPHVQLRGEIPPQEVGNMGHNYGWDQGPYGSTIGPTGMDGQIAADNYLNSGLTNGDVRDGGTANYPGPPNSAANTPPQIATGGPQPVSQPGVAQAPAVSLKGAINQMAQRQTGR